MEQVDGVDDVELKGLGQDVDPSPVLVDVVGEPIDVEQVGCLDDVELKGLGLDVDPSAVLVDKVGEPGPDEAVAEAGPVLCVLGLFVFLVLGM